MLKFKAAGPQGRVLKRKIVRNKDEGDKGGDEDSQLSILQNIEVVMYCMCLTFLEMFNFSPSASTTLKGQHF